MGKNTIMFVICILLVGFSKTALAGDYNFSCEDDADDVFEMSNEDITTDQFPYIDIINAETEEDDNNIVFTLSVNSEGSIVDHPDFKYLFLIGPADDPGSNVIKYSNGEAFFNDSITLQSSVVENNLTITVPKSTISNIETPWTVSVYTQAYTLYKDTADLELKPDTGDENDEDNESGDNNTASDGDGNVTSSGGSGDKKIDGIPGFELLTLITAGIAMFIMVSKRKK